MTYNVFGGTLNCTLLLHLADHLPHRLQKCETLYCTHSPHLQLCHSCMVFIWLSVNGAAVGAVCVLVEYSVMFFALLIVHVVKYV